METGEKTTEQKQTEYLQADKIKISDIKTKLPKELIPTKKTEYIFGGIFLLVLILSLFQIPFSSLLAGNLDQTISIGMPLPFLEFHMAEPETFPLHFLNLLIDLILYFVVSYSIDITINIFLKSSSKETSENKKTEKVKEYNISKNIETKNKDKDILEKKTKTIPEKVDEIIKQEKN